MTKTNRKLGKGLGAIFGENTQDILDDIQRGENRDYTTENREIRVDKILANPYQPRRHFDEAALKELADSISLHGVITPILVRKSLIGYELIAGERRWRASKIANKETIPAIIVEFSDEEMMEIALIENIQREDLNVIEEAKAYQSLIEKLGYSQEELAKRMNKSRSHITNVLRLLKLPGEVIDMVMENKLTMGHVRPLVTLESRAEMIRVAKLAIAKKMSVREVEAYLKKEPTQKIKITHQPKREYQYPIQLLEKKFQTKCFIDNKKITLTFTNDEDLNRLLDLMDVLEDI